MTHMTKEHATLATNMESGTPRPGTATGGDGAHAAIGADTISRAASVGNEERHDRIRWGAVWTGALTTLATYIVLQLLFFALGWLDLGLNGATGSGTTRAVISGVLAMDEPMPDG
jgi:hypothetical protein